VVMVQLTQLGKKLTDPINEFGTRSRMLPVGESSQVTFDIGSWYSWVPGAYKIAVVGVILSAAASIR
jgi:hypothetical protein